MAPSALLASTAEPDTFRPLERSRSGWGDDHVRGMAVTGALARAAERTVTADRGGPMTPARFTFDLFRPVRMTDFSTAGRIRRSGRRICLIDVEARQHGEPVARASVLFAEPAGGRSSPIWNDGAAPSPPSVDAAAPAHLERVYGTDRRGWLPPGEIPGDDDRKWVWHFPIQLVEGEEVTAFQSAAAVADVVNAVCHTGARGLEFINADGSMTLSRSPVGRSIGLVASTRFESAGVSAASAIVFDDDGPFGTVTATGLAAPPVQLLSPLAIRE
ncbi:acyl-CoA thioesterase domain-containing protein [Gordonia neofelifaecis]|uniref:Thioesterase-like superfamily protein n=1 Tax=Gordonia neofelifaecis NRRL B-59395 TaxID=644548 RepID=F1YK84_9ACTN|nr:acyl-CoA thioesterase domain-containing protein [Gordonia neofelifaecis]EGD54930.1 hypothetical protein SCNU_12005 [Gordonia neofelifaecis NRRL B-59395]